MSKRPTRPKPPTSKPAGPKLPAAGAHDLGEELIRGLTGLRDAIRGDEDLGERFTMRTVRLELEPSEYGAEEIRRLRHRLRASQAVFAKLVGVSAKTVQAWEQGSPAPAIARRLFDLMEQDLSVWEDLLQAAASGGAGHARRPA